MTNGKATQEMTPDKEKISLKAPAMAFLAGLVVFGAVSAERLARHSRDNHYVYLADAILHGRLHIEGDPPHRNDWAKYGDNWYVSFPPAPGVLMIPAVAAFGLEMNDRLFTLLFAAAGPALLLWLLQILAAGGRISRTPKENALLSALYGVGTVYFFSAVQGSVWYTAHMVGGVFLLLYLIASLDGKHPVFAGLCLGLAAASRPPMLLAFPFFFHEMLRLKAIDQNAGVLRSTSGALKSLGTKETASKLLLFAAPVALVIAGLLAMNWACFDNPFDFGHRYLKIRWSGRIERWGLFNYHYLARNLTVALTLLPWISETYPYIGISKHGLAIWFTTPVFLWVLWPRKNTPFYAFLAISCAAVALPSLFYQNSGWIQFGYRFSLDYSVFLVLMLAASGRKFGKLFMVLAAFAFAVNLFGAITFERWRQIYPDESTASYFQPD